MSNLYKRAFEALNLIQYSKQNLPDHVGFFELDIPKEKQYILRCLIKEPFCDFKIPQELKWLTDFINKTFIYQTNEIKVNQPFCYITVRSGYIESVTDDDWHVDGFSMNITHLPEQNYVWVDHSPTEYLDEIFYFPVDFSPFKHNIHHFFKDNMNSKPNIKKVKEKNIYCFDPYVIHRRPQTNFNIKRTFIRVSYTPIEIVDKNNYQNPEIPKNYQRDGIIDFRNHLTTYGDNK
jgi:hypothetical protein